MINWDSCLQFQIHVSCIGLVTYYVYTSFQVTCKDEYRSVKCEYNLSI